MRLAGLLLVMLAGCAARAPAPAVQEIVSAPCRIRPVTVSSRDFLSAETLAQIRRVNREVRRQCAG